MLKVYLDWNCITHCKDLWPELEELLGRYGSVFICPFSEAHIRDVQRSSSSNSEYYQKDLDLLTRISGMNMLRFEGKELALSKASPRECIEKKVGAYDCNLNFLTQFYRSFQRYTKFWLGRKVVSDISNVKLPKDVIRLIDGYVSKETNGLYSVDTLLNKFCRSTDADLVSRIRIRYYFLDLIGYKKEKNNKSLANIDADAQHIAFASICDYLISDDDRMRDKAKVIYGMENCSTKVMDPHEFIKEMNDIVKFCNDIDRIPDIMQTNGWPSILEDGAHYRKIDFPLWATFNLCFNTASLSSTMPSNEALFVIDKFMFYDELQPLIYSIFHTLPISQQRGLAEQFAQSFTKSIPFADIPFEMVSQRYRYHCVLKKFNNLPALHVSYDCVS